jgi:hypothetical protein
LPFVGEAVVAARERRARGAERRGRQVHERDAEDVAVWDALDGVGAVVERVAALDSQEGAVFAERARVPVLRARCARAVKCSGTSAKIDFSWARFSKKAASRSGATFAGLVVMTQIAPPSCASRMRGKSTWL